MTPLPGEPPIRRILIRVNNWIGDVVMVSPAMRSIRRRFPDAEITLLAKPWVLDALRGSPVYDRLIEYDREGPHAGLAGRWRLIRSLRKRHFDLAILFQKALEAAVLARAAGIPLQIGFGTDGRRWLLTHPLEAPAEGHHVDGFLRIARALGCETSDRRLSFEIDQQARDAVWGFLSGIGLGGDGLRVAFHPGASKPPRSWHPERFAEVASALYRSFDLRPVLLGSDPDRPVLERMARVIGPAAALPPQGMTLRMMAAILERCHLLVCNDSGPMHVAVALRVPVVAVFGPGHPERTGPAFNRGLARVVTADYPCSPCRQRFFQECIPAPSGKPYCMEDIPVEAVVRACRVMLGERGTSGPSEGATGVGADAEGG